MNNYLQSLTIVWHCVLLFLISSGKLLAQHELPAKPIDPQLAAKSMAVVRAQITESGVGSKYIRTDVKVLDTYKSPNGTKLPATINLAYYSFGKGIPFGEATLYLTPYNKEHPEYGWKLLEVYDGQTKTYAKGYSHHASVDEQEVRIKVEGGSVAGTLSKAIGENAHKKRAVFIVSGSGPTDRDGNTVGALGKNNSLKLLSDELVKSGVTTLRIDKRGVAGSANVMTKEVDLRFGHYVNDITRGIEFLKREGYTEITLLGHSEGALVVTIAAKHKSVVSVIAVAGVGNRFQNTLRKQMKPVFPEALYEEADMILTSLSKQERVKNVAPALHSLFRPSVQPYLISLYKINPAEEMAKLDIPVLIIQGTTDLQVFVEDAKLLNKAAKKGKLVLIEGMNHVLKKAGGSMQLQWSSYYIPKFPLHPQLCKSVSDFLKQ